jgi:hypothetical protein
MGKACITNGETRSVCRILVGKPEEKRSLARPSRGWVNNSNMNLRDGIGWYELD